MTAAQAFAFAFDLNRIGHLLGQGHPLHYTFIYLLTNLGWRIGDLHGPYLIGFSIEALNVCLFFSLLRRIFDWRLGLVAGIAYVLYSADTTQAYLTYSLGIHPSLTFFLLASHAYVSEKRWLAYLLAPLMLLTYETIYPVFFAVPLLAWVKAPAMAGACLPRRRSGGHLVAVRRLAVCRRGRPDRRLDPERPDHPLGSHAGGASRQPGDLCLSDGANPSGAGP